MAKLSVSMGSKKLIYFAQSHLMSFFGLKIASILGKARGPGPARAVFSRLGRARSSNFIDGPGLGLGPSSNFFKMQGSRLEKFGPVPPLVIRDCHGYKG